MTRAVHIDHRAGVVTKPVARDGLMCEVRMTQAAYELASGGSLFRVPRVVAYDLSEQWIKLEYIDGTVPLHHLLRQKNAPAEVFDRAARTVALIHRDLQLAPEHRRPLPPEFDRGGPQAFLHGDLYLINVRYRPATEELVLIDWSSSPLIGMAANWGTVYWDLAFFLRSLVASPPIRLTGKQMRYDLADAFLQTYVTCLGQGVLGRPFFQYCSEIASFLNYHNRGTLAWYKYLRFHLFNVTGFQRYLEQRMAEGREFS
jgi:hypothetical protein